MSEVVFNFVEDAGLSHEKITLSKVSPQKVLYTSVVITSLFIGGVAVNVTPIGKQEQIIVKSKDQLIKSDVFESVSRRKYNGQAFISRVVENGGIIDSEEAIDMNLFEKTVNELRVMKKIGTIVGATLGVLILSTPFFSTVDWSTAILASFLGFSLPIFSILESKART